MGIAKLTVEGSDYIGALASVTEDYVFVGTGMPSKMKVLMAENLKAEPVTMSVSGTNLVGLFVKANSNGLLISNMVEEYELGHLKDQHPDIDIAVLDSNLNALGNNIIANDKIAIINPEYSQEAARQIEEVLDVEVVRDTIGGFKTIGANNILTNKGLAVNNRATDMEKERLDKLLGVDSVRTTANTGALSIGLSTAANSSGVVVGRSTTGFELNRILDALDLMD